MNETGKEGTRYERPGRGGKYSVPGQKFFGHGIGPYDRRQQKQGAHHFRSAGPNRGDDPGFMQVQIQCIMIRNP